MFRYRLYTADGDELGEATYAQMIRPGEEIIARGNRRYHVLALVPEGGRLAIRVATAGRAGVAEPDATPRRDSGAGSCPYLLPGRQRRLGGFASSAGEAVRSFSGCRRRVRRERIARNYERVAGGFPCAH